MPTTTDANRIAQPAPSQKPLLSKVFGRVCVLGADEEVLRDWYIDKQNPIVGADSRADIQIAELQPRHLTIVFGRRNTLIKSAQGMFGIGNKQVRECLIDEPTTIQINDLKLRVFPTTFVRKPHLSSTEPVESEQAAAETESVSSSNLLATQNGPEQLSDKINEEKLQQLIVASTVAAMQKSLEPLSQTLLTLNQKFESLPNQSQDTAQLSIEIEKRFEQIERQLPTLANEIEHLNQKFDSTREKSDESIQSLATGIRDQIAGIVDRIQESSSNREQAIERTLGALSDQLNQLQSKIEDSQLHYGADEVADQVQYQEHTVAPESSNGWFHNNVTTDYGSLNQVANDHQVSESYPPVGDREDKYAEQVSNLSEEHQSQVDSEPSDYSSNEAASWQLGATDDADSDEAYSPVNYFTDRTVQPVEPDSHYYSTVEDEYQTEEDLYDDSLTDQSGNSPSSWTQSNAADVINDAQELGSYDDTYAKPYSDNLQREISYDAAEQEEAEVGRSNDARYPDDLVEEAPHSEEYNVDYHQRDQFSADELTYNYSSLEESSAAESYNSSGAIEQNEDKETTPRKLPTWFVKEDASNEVSHSNESEIEDNVSRDNVDDLDGEYQSLREQPSAVYTPFRSQPIDRNSIRSRDEEVREEVDEDVNIEPRAREQFSSSESGSYLQNWQKTDAADLKEEVEDEFESTNISAVYSRSSQSEVGEQPSFSQEEDQEPDLELPVIDREVSSTASAAIDNNAESDSEEEESVESYMQRLLARVKGEAEPIPPPPVPKSATQKPAPKSVSLETVREEPTLPKTTTQVNQALARKRQLELEESLGLETLSHDAYIPRSAVPEQTVDLDAMRKLANETARTAIARSNKKPASEKPNVKGKLAMAIVGFIVGTAILLMNGLTMNIAFVGMVCGYLIFLIWGYEASQAAPATTKRS